ncbi:hypothetical protein K474DRAFT_1522283 [Panus rudis PR-1116 ss-1]|nr:hypothetical protein K474DRAFT_1522283 [Panus rudis PR-1116 ss-1]
MPFLESLECFSHSSSPELLSVIPTFPKLRRLVAVWQDAYDIVPLLSYPPLQDVYLIFSNVGAFSVSASEPLRTAPIDDNPPHDTMTSLSPLDMSCFRHLVQICVNARGIDSSNIRRLCSLQLPSLRSFHLGHVLINTPLVLSFVTRHPSLTDVSVSFMETPFMQLSTAINLASQNACMATDDTTLHARATNATTMPQFMIDGFAFERTVCATSNESWDYTVIAFAVYVPAIPLEANGEFPKLSDILRAIATETALARGLRELNVITGNTAYDRATMGVVWVSTHLIRGSYCNLLFSG